MESEFEEKTKDLSKEQTPQESDDQDKPSSRSNDDTKPMASEPALPTREVRALSQNIPGPRGSQPIFPGSKKINVILSHPKNKDWKLIQAPPRNGVRQWSRCIHLDSTKKPHQTAFVCIRCRRFVCKSHWTASTHFSSYQSYDML